jgi:hypothetical protein
MFYASISFFISPSDIKTIPKSAGVFSHHCIIKKFVKSLNCKNNRKVEVTASFFSDGFFKDGFFLVGVFF